MKNMTNKKNMLASGVNKRWARRKRALLAITAAVLLAVGMTGCAKGGSSDTIQVATKGFAESDILANALKLLIEQETDLKADVKSWITICSGMRSRLMKWTLMWNIPERHLLIS